MSNKIAVLGSINVDTTYHMDRFPEPGETLQANDKSSAPGGKGANQSVACARSGAKTYHIGMVGADQEGQFMRESMQEDGIDTRFVGIDKMHGTGTAMITLDANGQNDIMVYGGANQSMTTDVLKGTDELFKDIDFIITQFETPQKVSAEAFKRAKANGVTTILNPAPAKEIDPELLKYTDVIAPNETESALLTGIEITDEDSMIKTAEYFKNKGVDNLLITLGSKGVFYSTPNDHGLVPAFKVKPVDTTAAGDTFIGALASQLKTDLSNIADALVYAQRASSLTVQKMGAAPSIPTYDEVKAALAEK
ncbi:ribokinase [Limosilactobacillus coleohominis]|uniref:Ribokinase n=1 Tax=Limosilactobacillus coleohominis TaxID=181675 RepID=A0ABS2GUQ9_9LACO|nr:ribokinase [Limosilactobacillus coleohominis]MCI5813258.1 ribokinase [Lactobacillus sp.]HJA23553.1 ribokinase [Candidatus Limosilactobacillus intestinavium]MBM6939985.1 ribokinase [Limosilactobacillus coleohominis]MBM6954443.1 ribokinase [Limosilactobacillus coleohominis]MDY3703229.1 ribokinase [Limosilactobacillus coleohominis]